MAKMKSESGISIRHVAKAKGGKRRNGMKSALAWRNKRRRQRRRNR